MERIQKALEKAREQRQAQQLSQEAKRSERDPAQPSGIVYQQTRVEQVSPRILRERRVVAGLVEDVRADIFRMLRTQVMQRLAAASGTTLGICSPNPGEGKTFAAANLAVSLAMDVNHTVLLVELDLRRPSLQDYFGIKPKLGLSDYLLEEVSLSDCLINPGIKRLVLLPAGRALKNSSEVLAAPKMTNLARELKDRYADRMVLYDLPPLLSSDDSLVFLPQVDATLLVIQEGKTRDGEIQRSLDLLKDNNLLGTVLNRSAEQNVYPYY
jgi:capsular exopolysaccharide synthesis family protein